MYQDFLNCNIWITQFNTMTWYYYFQILPVDITKWRYNVIILLSHDNYVG